MHAMTIPLALLGLAGLPQATVVDGIAAIVNDEIISIGEVRRAARVAGDPELRRLAATCGAPVAPGVPVGALPTEPAPEPAASLVGDEALVAALECLIDRTLLFREVRRFPQLEVTGADVDVAYERLAAGLPGAAALERQLARHGMSRQIVREDLRRQLLIANYIDNRFRATVDISAEQARQYWDDTLVPDMQQRGIEIPPFDSVDEEFVVPILREQEVNRRVQSWIADLRQRATIIRKFP